MFSCFFRALVPNKNKNQIIGPGDSDGLAVRTSGRRAANPLIAARSDSAKAAGMFYTIEISISLETPMLSTLDSLCNNHSWCDHNNSVEYSGFFYNTFPLKQKHLGISQLQVGPVGQPEADEGLTTPPVTFSASWPASPHWRHLESRLFLNASRLMLWGLC